MKVITTIFRVVVLLFGLGFSASLIAGIVEIEKGKTEWAQNFRKDISGYLTEIVCLIIAILVAFGAVVGFVRHL